MKSRNFKIAIGTMVFAFSAAAADLNVYVTNGFQFGTVALSTGAYSPIGSGTPEGITSLVSGPNGSLLTVAFNGNLESINPNVGSSTVIGATGLSDCSTPSSACGPTSPNTIGSLGRDIYATDFQNTLYTVNAATGATKAIGLTGIHAVPFVPLTSPGAGLLNIYDETLFASGGVLYATMDAGILSLTDGSVQTVVDPMLYKIDPTTGLATPIGSTMFGIGAAVDINGTVYAFDDHDGKIGTLNLSNGGLTTLASFDTNVTGIITGAVATPEPATAALAILGLGLAFLLRSRFTASARRSTEPR